MTVKEIIGSSLLVCEPLLNEEEYWNNTEFVDYKIKRQLESVLNAQGYWSGCAIRVYYDADTKDFTIGNRY